MFTDYFGGVGDQYAQIYRGIEILDSKVVTINQALRKFGVKSSRRSDEFEMVGLHKIRHNPDYLEKYCDMADDLGV